MNRTRAVAGGLCMAALATLPGCLAAPAYVMTAGLSAAQGGASMWMEGELVGSFNEMYPDMVWACEAMAKQLALTIRVRRLDPETYFLFLEDDNGVDIDITVARRTAKLCQINVRVGVWGNKPVSTLVMKTIETELIARHADNKAEDPQAPLPANTPEQNTPEPPPES